MCIPVLPAFFRSVSLPSATLPADSHKLLIETQLERRSYMMDFLYGYKGTMLRSSGAPSHSSHASDPSFSRSWEASTYPYFPLFPMDQMFNPEPAPETPSAAPLYFWRRGHGQCFRLSQFPGRPIRTAVSGSQWPMCPGSSGRPPIPPSGG